MFEIVDHVTLDKVALGLKLRGSLATSASHRLRTGVLTSIGYASASFPTNAKA
jgi:hypothetical protein